MSKQFKMQVEWRAPDSLTPYARNSKIHTTEQIDKIAGQIAAVGFDQPIVIDKEGVIIKGHGRRQAALRLGLKEVPVVVASHLTEYEAMAARIADNKVSESAWDADLLRFDLGTLQTHDFDLALTGFDMPDLGNFIESGAVTSQVFAGGGMPASAGTPVEDPVPPPFEFKPPNEEQTESSQEFTVVVTLESAEDQQELFTELRDRGLRVKA